MSWKRTPEQNKIKYLKSKEYHKLYYQRNKIKMDIKSHRSNLKNKFGLTIEDYNKLLTEQNFSCALCSKHVSENKKRLAVDHCHETGRVRGLLCMHCNAALGQLGDTSESIQRVLEYINVGI